jgi:3-oxoacyl-[acyl-carrier-protein] synthase-3
MHASSILGTGSYLPEKVLTNLELEKMVDTSDAWITERTGIKERHVAAPDEVTSDLCHKAALKALEAAQIKPEDIDAIFLATVTPDMQMPSTACFLQAKLGCRNVMSFDLAAACSGFLYNLTIADQFIKTGLYKNILVVGAEVLTRMMNYKDRETCILFGDGAGAAIVGRSTNPTKSQILAHSIYADGNLADLLDFQAGGSKMPYTHHVLDTGAHFLRMKGRDIFKNAVRAMSGCAKESLEKAGLTVADVHWVIPHQANVRIIEAVADHLGVEKTKCIVNIGHMGNTSAATIPVALDEAVRDGRIQRGQLVLLTAFGSGLTYGSTLLRF